jgi:hypothetical protein
MCDSSSTIDVKQQEGETKSICGNLIQDQPDPRHTGPSRKTVGTINPKRIP